MYGWPSDSPTSKIVTMFGRAREPRRGERLAFEPLPHGLVVGVPVGEYLDRHSAPELFVQSRGRRHPYRRGPGAGDCGTAAEG